MHELVTRELNIRKALRRFEIQRIRREDPYCLIIDEFAILKGKYRIDMAVVGKMFHGWEIKSGADTLERLPAQQSRYNRIFDRLTLVAEEHHVQRATAIIPPWWGLISVSTREDQLVLDEIWPARQNPSIDPLALAQLLWRDEVLRLLSLKGLSTGMSRKPRKALWSMLSSSTTTDELKELVAQSLKSRTDWRA